MLGVMLGLRAACQRRDLKRIAIWLGALLVYPVLMLLLGGFLSYGSAAIIIVCAAAHHFNAKLLAGCHWHCRLCHSYV